MNNIKKSMYKSPLLGAVFLTILSIIYASIFLLSYQDGISRNIEALVKITPILLVIFIIISYFLSIPIGFLIYQEMKRNFRTEKFFVNLSLFIGFCLSLIIAIIDYSFHHQLAKSFFIVIGISLMAIINANYFLILAGIIKIKEKKNENTKGSGV